MVSYARARNIKEGVLAAAYAAQCGSKPSGARAGGQSHKPALIGDWLYQGAAAVVL